MEYFGERKKIFLFAHPRVRRAQTSHSLAMSMLQILTLPPNFDLLHEFQLQLEEKYGGFHRDQMQRIQILEAEEGRHTLYHVYEVGEICQRMCRCFRG